MNGEDVYNIVCWELERQKQEYFNLTGEGYIDGLRTIYIGDKIKSILTNWNNSLLAKPIKRYGTFKGMKILDKPRYGCLMVRDSLIQEAK